MLIWGISVVALFVFCSPLRKIRLKIYRFSQTAVGFETRSFELLIVWLFLQEQNTQTFTSTFVFSILISLSAELSALYPSFFRFFSVLCRNIRGSSWRSNDRPSDCSDSCSRSGRTSSHCNNSSKSHGPPTKNNCTTTKTQSIPVTNQHGPKRY